MSNDRMTCLILGNPSGQAPERTESVFQFDKGYLKAIQDVCSNIGIDCITVLDLLHPEVTLSELHNSIQSTDILLVELLGLSNELVSLLRQRKEVKSATTIFISTENSNESDWEGDRIFPPDYVLSDGGLTVDEKQVQFADWIREKLIRITGLQPSPGRNRLVSTDKELEDKRPESFEDFLKLAEQAKSNGDFSRAKALFSVARFLNDQDHWIIQRLCLVTYKRDDSSVKALEEARGIIDALEPKKSEDPETIGLCGAINKRLFEATANKKYFDESLWFYNRGYEVKKDYYNGINLAFTYNRRAAKLAESKAQATKDFKRAETIRKDVLAICLAIVDEPGFESRDDKNWVYLTLAEAYLGFKMEPEYILAVKRAKYYSEGVFDRYSFERQSIRLLNYLNEYQAKYQDQE